MLYVDLMQSFGWTWEYVDEQMDLVRVDAIYKGFRKKPPIHWIGAAFVKFKPVDSSASEGGSAAGPKPNDLFESMAGRMLDG